MKDSTFYLRLGSIWDNLNSFLRELSIPTHTHKAITDIAENLMRIEINNFFNDWLVVAYIPDEKNVEEPQLRKPSGIIEKKIYDYLHECLYILVQWWEHKKEPEQWNKTAIKLRPICNEIKEICAESNRQPIQALGVIAGLKKVAELLKELGSCNYTLRHTKSLSWDLSSLFSDVALDVIYTDKGVSKSFEKKHETEKEGDIKAIILDVREILDNIEQVTSDDADKSAKKLLYLANELEKINISESETDKSRKPLSEKANKRKSKSKIKQQGKEQGYKIPKNYINQKAYNEGRRARLAKYYNSGKSPIIETSLICEFQFEQALVVLKAMIESYNEIDIDWGMDDEAWNNKRIIEETAAKYRGAGSQLPTSGFGDICIRTAENAVRNYAELSHTYYDVCELSNQVKQTKNIQQIQIILLEMSSYLSYLDFDLYKLLEDGHKKEVLGFIRDIVQKLYEQVGKRLKRYVARYKIYDYLHSYKAQSQKTSGESDVKTSDSGQKIKKDIKMSLREFMEKCTDVGLDAEANSIITSKIKRIKAVNKKKNVLPKTANNPEGNQTKLYFKQDLICVWPALKNEIPTLPNLKNIL